MTKSKTLLEKKRTPRKDGEAFDFGAHMMEKVFLVANIKGLMQLRYFTISEAKIEAI